MGTLKVSSKSLQSNATYTSENYKVELSYTEDAKSGTLKDISGTIYKGETMSHAGNFNGRTNGDGEVSYSFSGIKTQDMGAVTDMILDIEQQIRKGGE